jgi:hypothetical protein
VQIPHDVLFQDASCALTLGALDYRICRKVKNDQSRRLQTHPRGTQHVLSGAENTQCLVFDASYTLKRLLLRHKLRCKAGALIKFVHCKTYLRVSQYALSCADIPQCLAFTTHLVQHPSLGTELLVTKKSTYSVRHTTPSVELQVHFGQSSFIFSTPGSAFSL